ncbi:hypothetical protein ACH4GM_18470 [Streptomyces coeruleorubidus]|uniref:hypothetical protein n=1 Tax=Streptomyces coeruleorubidus TaxID=116188 RepID=UPI00378F0B2D
MADTVTREPMAVDSLVRIGSQAPPTASASSRSTAGGQEPSTPLARTITAVVTPDSVYDGSVVTRP